jgi:hypothetical protein
LPARASPVESAVEPLVAVVVRVSCWFRIVLVLVTVEVESDVAWVE